MAKKAVKNVYEFDISCQDPMQVNVRRDATDGSLRPVGKPASVCNVPGTILGAVACDGRDVIVTATDGSVYATDTVTGLTEKVADADVDFTAGVATDGGLLLTADLSGRSPVGIAVDRATGKAIVRKQLDRRYAPRLSRIDGGTVTRPLPERTLKGTYSRTALMLQPDDLHSLTSDYTAATAIYADSHRLPADMCSR